ncbi:hypothetical protein AMAG_17786 [Allomyces macrogynus ATCC 38327]|uniref:Trimethylguanosine synthase n=1 Tax=Allomyces macrogynus (strain ATCC 38327) TaxID=578462 RepID=A0A0L0RZE3_ALLM3|nr:hypothetical protein AMAG_17786 [Allomyces macrogynus ATCC 38327]|eukprot:KNE55434.1 hypothetical protein AMAG_17786 [Allomyces macrogynus ATCC 38327]
MARTKTNKNRERNKAARAAAAAAANAHTQPTVAEKAAAARAIRKQAVTGPGVRAQALARSVKLPTEGLHTSRRLRRAKQRTVKVPLLADLLPPPTNGQASLPDRVKKYWSRRRNFFSKFDEGVRMDEVGWFSVTPEPIAQHLAERCRSNLVIDAFAGVAAAARAIRKQAVTGPGVRAQALARSVKLPTEGLHTSRRLRRAKQRTVKVPLLADLLPPPTNGQASLPDRVKKYWSRRRNFFSKFDEGVRMDEVGWFSVTPEPIAQHLAERCRSNLVIDAFAGVGGNAIQFAVTCEQVVAIELDPVRLACARHNAEIYGVADRIEFILGDAIQFLERTKLQPDFAVTCEQVVAIELDPVRLACARHNAEIYGVADRIEFILGDAIQFLERTKLQPDVIFLSPPWGGPEYLQQESYTLDMMPLDWKRLLKACYKLTPNLAIFMPKNLHADAISRLARGHAVEVEEMITFRSMRAVTLYTGALAVAATSNSDEVEEEEEEEEEDGEVEPFLERTKLQPDVIFLSPPWGGPEYLQQESYTLDMMPLDWKRLLKACYKLTPNLAIYMPKNLHDNAIPRLARGHVVEVEEMVTHRNVRAVTLYTGALAVAATASDDDDDEVEEAANRKRLLKACYKLTPNLAIFMPKNLHADAISRLARGHAVEVEEMITFRSMRAVTLYTGALAVAATSNSDEVEEEEEEEEEDGEVEPVETSP